MFVAMLATVMTLGTVAAKTVQNSETQNNDNLTAEQMAKLQTERMTKAFGLNKQQQKKLYEYDIRRFAKMQKRAEVYRDAMASERKNHEAQMQAILTPEQYQKWLDMQK